MAVNKRKSDTADNVELSKKKSSVKKQKVLKTKETAAVPQLKPTEPKAKKRKNTQADKKATAEVADNSEKVKKNRKEDVTKYLNTWEQDRKAWKFNKKLQNVLAQTFLMPNLVNDEMFLIAIEYFDKGSDAIKAEVMRLAERKFTSLKKKETLEEHDATEMDRIKLLRKKFKDVPIGTKKSRKQKKNASVNKETEGKTKKGKKVVKEPGSSDEEVKDDDDKAKDDEGSDAVGSDNDDIPGDEEKGGEKVDEGDSESSD